MLLWMRTVHIPLMWLHLSYSVTLLLKIDCSFFVFYSVIINVIFPSVFSISFLVRFSSDFLYRSYIFIIKRLLNSVSFCCILCYCVYYIVLQASRNHNDIVVNKPRYRWGTDECYCSQLAQWFTRWPGVLLLACREFNSPPVPWFDSSPGYFCTILFELESCIDLCTSQQHKCHFQTFDT